MTPEDKVKIEKTIERLQLLLMQDPEMVSNVAVNEYMTGSQMLEAYARYEFSEETQTCKISILWKEPIDFLERRMAIYRQLKTSSSIKEYDNIVRAYELIREAVGCEEQGQEE